MQDTQKNQEDILMDALNEELDAALEQIKSGDLESCGATLANALEIAKKLPKKEETSYEQL